MATKQNTNQNTNSLIPYHKQPKYQPLYQLFFSIQQIDNFDNSIQNLFGETETSELEVQTNNLFQAFLDLSGLTMICGAIDIDKIWDIMFSSELDVHVKFEKIMSYLESEEA